jgi:hypothetical protein
MLSDFAVRSIMEKTCAIGTDFEDFFIVDKDGDRIARGNNNLNAISGFLSDIHFGSHRNKEGIFVKTSIRNLIIV